MRDDYFPISKKTFNLAVGFHASADRLVKWLNEEVEWRHTPPEACCIVVNYALSAELYLKAMLYRENGEENSSIMGHKLNELFDKLSEGVKDKLREHQVIARPDYENLETESFDIEETLIIYNTAFIDYRYLYEEKNRHVRGEISGIMKACDILRSVFKPIVFNRHNARLP